MSKKIIPVISVIAISVMAIFFLFDSSSQNKDILKSTFKIDATYYDSGYVEISYLDKTNNTSYVVLEVLGMENSFQKNFTSSEFIEMVAFSAPPKYGWQIHPVVFQINHNDLGKISLKTEIHELGQPAPPIIYGNQ